MSILNRNNGDERKLYYEDLKQFNDTSEFNTLSQDDKDIENYENYKDNCYDNTNYLSDKIISGLFLILKIILKIIMLPLLILIFFLDRLLKILSRIIGTGLILASIIAALAITYKYNFIDQNYKDDFLSKLIISGLVFIFALVILIIPPKVHLAYLKTKNFIFSINNN